MKEQVIKELKNWVEYNYQTMKFENSKKATAYIRVSTDKQTELSPISQLKEIYKYAINNQIYLDIDNIFIEEEGISAKDSKIKKRTEFNRMIALAKTKNRPFDTIIVWKFSRFARSQEQSIIFKKLLRKECNIEIKSVSEPIIDGPFGELMERIIEWSDEYYLTNLAQEVMRGMTEAANEGKYQAGAPFGYKWSENKSNRNLIIKEEEAEIVKLIYSKYISNEMTITELARYINTLNYKTKRGGLFENRTIEYILLNPIYKGYTRWTPNGKLTRNEIYNNTRSIIVKGKHQPIIDEKTWELVNNKFKKCKIHKQYHQSDTNNPWSWIKGLIRCKKCGRTFVKTDNKLRCNGYNKGACTCSDKICPQAAEKVILEQLKKYCNSSINITINEKETKTSVNEKKILKTQLLFLQQKEKRIKNSYINGVDSLDEYKKNKISLENEKKQLISRINTLSDKKKESILPTITENLKNCYDILASNSIEMIKKYTIAHELINRIEYENRILLLYFNVIK